MFKLRHQVSNLSSICNITTSNIAHMYLPKRLNPLAPNEPSHPVIGMPANDVTSAVPDDATPITPQKQLAPKKTFETGLGEQ